ncbi:MAG: response regulator transcription factor [Candidatus Brocadiales bacterium]|nr:response regulator transcription factor [Candidatus Brocadiales bacterium]
MKKVRILLIEDHTIVRQGIKQLLKLHDAYDVVGEASDGLCAINEVKAMLPDVVILDISIPKMNGIEIAKQIRRISPDAKIIVLTMYESKEFITRMLDMGVSAYLNKESTDTDLVTAIESTIKGQVFLSPSVSRILVETLTGKKTDTLISDDDKEAYNKLTDREKTILYMVAEGYGSKEISKFLSISVNTINNHRTSIMKKLNIHDAVGLAKFAIKMGLLTNVESKESF